MVQSFLRKLRWVRKTLLLVVVLVVRCKMLVSSLEQLFDWRPGLTVSQGIPTIRVTTERDLGGLRPPPGLWGPIGSKVGARGFS